MENEFDEVNLAALKILQAYRSGTKFSEMALIVRDAETRKGLIEAVFEKAGIPFFISERTDLSSSAAARLIFSALRCVTYNFRTSDVLTLLKTGLCGIDPSDADLFEDYVYTWSISGNKFLEDIWSMNPDGYTKDEPSGRSHEILLAANRVRSAVIPPLVRLRTKFSSAKGNTLENCRAIYDYLGEIGIESSLSALAEFDVATGNLRGAGESLRIYDSIVTSLSSIAQILSDTPTTSEELLTQAGEALNAEVAPDLAITGGERTVYVFRFQLTATAEEQAKILAEEGHTTLSQDNLLAVIPAGE